MFRLGARTQYPLSKLVWRFNYIVKCVPGFQCEWTWKFYILKLRHLSCLLPLGVIWVVLAPLSVPSGE